jgi:alkylation response protein AidB-like acyl-CoA dehydrogenase
MWWPKTTRQAELVALAGELADRFARRAEAHDRAGSFPHQNFHELHASGYLALTIPREFGGGGASLLEATLAQARLGCGDGSTALGASMHLSILGRIGRALVAGDAAEAGGWDWERYARVARSVIEEGALVNSAASEPETGSPSRGGRPATKAVALDGAFRLTGRKTYTTMAPGLRFVIVSATLDGLDGPEAGQFLVETGLPGLRIEETWDALGMRASGSHDLVLDGVEVPAAALLSRRPYAPAVPAGPGAPAGPAAQIGAPAATAGRASAARASANDSGAPDAPALVEPSALPEGTSSGGRAAGGAPPGEGPGWALLVPAVYLGIAAAAGQEAVRFARERRPSPLAGQSIGDLPAVQRTLGEIEVALAESRALLFGAAEAWLEAPARRAELLPLLGAAKYVATNRAVEVAERAMRVVGGAGLARTHPVQRYYRDVRAGLHHPPMDDVALATLARAALAR